MAVAVAVVTAHVAVITIPGSVPAVAVPVAFLRRAVSRAVAAAECCAHNFLYRQLPTLESKGRCLR